MRRALSPPSPLFCGSHHLRGFPASNLFPFEHALCIVATSSKFDFYHSVVYKQLLGSCQVPRLGSRALHDAVPSCLFSSLGSTYCRHIDFLSFGLWQTGPFSVFTSFSMLPLDCCPHLHLEQDPVCVLPSSWTISRSV